MADGAYNVGGQAHTITTLSHQPQEQTTRATLVHVRCVRRTSTLGREGGREGGRDHALTCVCGHGGRAPRCPERCLLHC